MRKRVNNLFVLITLLVTSLSTASAQQMNQESIVKFGQLLYFLENFYIESVDSDHMTEEAVKRVLELLDPHSTYISAKDVKAMNEPLEGNFEGVGIEFAIIRDTLTVASPVSGGPSEKVGIKAGDKIVTVDGESIASISLTNQQVHSYLRGEKGSRVNLEVVRKGVEDKLFFTVVRDKIPIHSVDALYEIEPGILYVKLGRFAANSTKEILEGMLELGITTVDGFILDLRGNSGGYLHTALEISNFFLEKGEAIVYTEGLHSPKSEEFAKGNGFFKEGPLAILIDEHSASASEIVSGAVQDWDRGVIIGRRSFGKGLVQRMMPLNDGAQLRLTVAQYHTPSGRAIQHPYEKGESEKYYNQLTERYERGEYFSRDSISFPDSLKYATLKEGRTVYGGGGIMPDIFVAADTTEHSNYYQHLIRRGVVTEFINSYWDGNRAAMKAKYDTFEKFDNHFSISPEELEELIKLATKEGIEYVEEELLRSKGRLLNYMKALIARNLHGNHAFYKVLNSYNDSELEKALNYIKKNI